ALGQQAARLGFSVLYTRAPRLLQELHVAHGDGSFGKRLGQLARLDLLILDDFGLQRMSAQQSTDMYELIIARHRHSSFVITSNRTVDEWLGLFDDAILGNSALDRLANASYQITIEGTSYRERLSPHRRRN
ncbi:MAG: ATP-binding protein, partial [Dehalococcoidia bacterium]|nr:ATP-binding protein [Dehalococcoidia bacterium]